MSAKNQNYKTRDNRDHTWCAARAVMDDIEPILNALRSSELGEAATRAVVPIEEGIDAAASACLAGERIPW